MAHFAQLDENNIVMQVIVVSNSAIDNLPFPESEPIGISLCQSLYGKDTNWKQTSYTNSFRKFYAGKGYTYDINLDAFIAPAPLPECILDLETCLWNCPPLDGKNYVWDQLTQSWVES